MFFFFFLLYIRHSSNPKTTKIAKGAESLILVGAVLYGEQVTALFSIT